MGLHVVLELMSVFLHVASSGVRIVCSATWYMDITGFKE